MKSNYLLIYFLLMSAFGFSQNYDIGGTVKESDSGIPIPGANITISNSTKSTSTDFDGKFSLKDIPSGSVIIVNYLGFKTYRYTVKSSNPSLRIPLQVDSKSLEEVVVIGYGTQKRKDITGSVVVLGNKTIEQLKPIKTEQALMGTVAGVFVTSQSGAPGAALDIRIRGVSSNGDNSPLVLIDGVIGDLSLLNPSDIESITVLKDVQTAIYGTRGANGVVLITSKKGKKNSAAVFSYNAYTGMQESTRKLPMLNATEYALLLNESYANAGRPLPYNNVSTLGKGTEWQDEILGNNIPIISHDLRVSGGSDKITYSVSGSHLYQEGIVGAGKSDFRRNTANIGLGVDLTDRLKLQTNLTYLYLNRDSVNENGLGSVLFNALNTPATISPYDTAGNFSLVPSTPGFGIEIINPLAQVANTYNDYNLKKFSGYVSLDYSLLKSLVFTGRTGFNTSNSEGRTFSKQVNYGPGKVFNVDRSSVDQNAINDNNYTLDLFLTYKKTFGESHNFTSTFGTTVIKDWGNGLFAKGYDVPNNSWEFADIALAQGPVTTSNNGSYAYDERLNTFFGRLQYDYNGKYLIQAILRRDSSTKFGPDNAVAYFPSVLAGWVISQESFLKDSKTFNFVKLRGSYGIVGNDKIRANGYAGRLDGEGVYVFDNVITNGRAIGLLANPNLKWEESKKFDLGLDLKLFNNHIDITADYFIENRHNLLVEGLPVSGITGVGGPGGQPPVVNAGSVRNKGFEFALGYNKKVTDNFSFNVNSNITTIENVVTGVSSDNNIIRAGSFGVGQQPIAAMEKGQTLGYFYGFETDGIFQNQAEVDAHPSQLALGANAAPGDIRYKDVNGDGKINLDDRKKIGSPLPDFTLGFNLTMNFKNVDFAVYSYASVGNDMVRNYERSLSDVNKANYALGRWTGEGTSNTVPRVTTDATANNVFSDYFVEDASFYRIQNVQIGYTLNTDYAKKAGILKLRLYTGINNVYTFTKYRGYDPAASNGAPIGGGIDYGFYPTPRTYMVGLNLNF